MFIIVAAKVRPQTTKSSLLVVRGTVNKLPAYDMDSHEVFNHEGH